MTDADELSGKFKFILLLLAVLVVGSLIYYVNHQIATLYDDQYADAFTQTQPN